MVEKLAIVLAVKLVAKLARLLVDYLAVKKG
jgi:hypothetical protein